MRLRSTIVLPILALIHTAVWLTGLRLLGVSAIDRWTFAQFLSSYVLVVAGVNLMLATRAHPIEGAFGGLDKMYASHRMDGIIAACIIVAHPIVAPITQPLLPGRALGLLTFAAIVGSVIFASAPRAPWRRLFEVKYQTWKAEHRFMGVFVAMAVVHSALVHTVVLSMPLVEAWVYGMAAVGLACYVYRETVFRSVMRRHVYRVATADHRGDRVLEVALEPAAHPIVHRPGQFAFLRFEEGPTREYHPFTLSAPPQGGPLRFSIKGSGDYTNALQERLRAGSSARIEGPYGRFDYRTGRPRQLWIAGGIGITPFLAFLPTLEPDRDVTLVWTVHDAAEAVYADEIAAIAAHRPALRIEIWPSAERGHVSLEELRLERPADLSVYLCGPVAMRSALLAQLDSLGVARREVHFEEFRLR